LLPPSLETTIPGGIWFHAVSVGEVLSALELIRWIRASRPSSRIYVSTTTLAGRATADQKLRGLADAVFFAPFDYRSMIRRVLRRLRPAAVVVLETEIWPNLYREAKRAGASLLLVNGRISDRALPRYRRWRGFFRHILRWPDAILAQTEEDRRRFEIAGAPPERVHVAGNVKYDFTPPAAIAPDLEHFLDRLSPKQVWIAGSTMSDGVLDEDDAVLAALSTLPEVLLILAPRKPERFDAVAEKLERARIPFVRRSRGLAGNARVLLLDSIGELAALFARADVVFMGGTLADRGGHNVLEPAYFGKPVIVGPHMENFAAVAAEFTEAGALERIDDAQTLGRTVRDLLGDPARRAQIGAKAKELAMARRGVASRIAEQISEAADDAVPDPGRTLPARFLLTPLSWLWRAGSAWNVTRSARVLPAPVISIGGLSMGGAGKTPMVTHLARRLRERGRAPAILTRGYKRSSREIVIVPRGGSCDRKCTGDEAQIFIRRGDAAVGIGADRYHTAQRMEADIFLLDDGFQHRKLARRHDIVLIDALDPLAGGVFPLGRLREVPAALARATEIVITRVEPGRGTRGIERWIARYNPAAPIFRAHVIPLRWRETGAAYDLSIPLGRAGAFCGLGNPRAFWRTLEQLGTTVVWRGSYPDHHRYSGAELKRLAAQATAAGAEILVTTEKDAVNLAAGAAELLAPLKLLWLEIGVEIEKEEEFLQRIL